jgi:hypothetical protein
MENLTLEQMILLLENKRVQLKEVSQRFKDVLEVWITVDGQEYRQILKDVPHNLFVEEVCNNNRINVKNIEGVLVNLLLGDRDE